MHDSVYRWVEQTVNGHGLAGLATLEIGSRDVNGSVRSLFTGCYLGVDVYPGRGVDLVAEAEHLAGVPAGWQVVVSTEMLEHCQRPWRALNEIWRVLRPGGHLLVTCRGYDDRGCWPVHNEPVDVWRFSWEALAVMASDSGFEIVTLAADPQGPGWFLHATK